MSILFFQNMLFVTCYRKQGDNVHMLRLADLYFTSFKDTEGSDEDILSQEQVFTDVFSHLRHNLTSPYSQVRPVFRSSMHFVIETCYFI